ncbi:MAG: hypothetical protein ABI321_08400 [Polyangia bacterium]
MRSLVGLVLLVASSAIAAPAAPVERRLHIGQAEASSFDRNDYNRFEENYLPLYVADDDATTAWTEGVPGDGTGQWLRVRFSSMKGATKIRLRIRNGYQKSHRLFAANERARKVTFTLLPGNTKTEKELTDTEGWQEVVLEQSSGVVAGVELKIGSVFPGKKYEDLCISDVQVFVTAETPDNPAFEKSVLDKVKKWKADRVDAAKAFARAAKDRPLSIASSYEVNRTDTPAQSASNHGFFSLVDRLDPKLLGAEERAAMTEAKAWLGKEAASFQPVSLGLGGRAKLPTVDGMCTPVLGSCEYDGCDAPNAPFDDMPLLTTDSFKLIEAKDRPALARLFDGTAAKLWPACNSKDGAVLAWAVRQGDDRKTRALVVMRCAVVEGREGSYISSEAQLLVYDEKGKLRLSAGPKITTSYAWKPDGSSIVGGSYVSLESTGTYAVANQVATAK